MTFKAPFSRAIIALIILCLLAIVASQQGDCNGNRDITSEAELSDIRDCESYDGSISIHNLTSSAAIDLSKLKKIKGNITVMHNLQVPEITFRNLDEVAGQLKIEGNRQLTHIRMPSLTSVKSMEIVVQPFLDSLTFPAQVSNIESFTLADTAASKIEGMAAKKIRNIHINNNANLKNLDLSRLEQVEGVIAIDANSPNLALDLSGLKEMYQGEFRNLGSINGLNRVERVTGDLSFESSSFSTLSLPNVTQIFGTLTVANNTNLENLTISELQVIGGAILLANNSRLATVDAPKLKAVEGTVDITGNFNELYLPALVDVRGGLNVQTSSVNFSCEQVNKLQGEVTKGQDFICLNKVINPKSTIDPRYNGQLDSPNGGSSMFTMAASFNLFTYILAITAFFLIQ